jgi:KDO2-lipid IV(A) lauroyltransferase
MLRRWLIHPLEALGFGLAMLLLRALPADAASGLCGAIARTVGPHLPVSRIAHANLARAMPTLDAAAIARIVRGVWDNCGRVIGEYPHLHRLAATRVEVVGAEHLARLRDGGPPGIFFSGHLGNWELLTATAARLGVRLTGVYRAPNNRLVDRLLQRLRGNVAELIPKGAAGARQALAALNRGAPLALLVDQKMNDGIAVTFFGRDAMTAPALAQHALRHDCPAWPARVERLGGARFRLTIEPPLALPRTGDRQADTRALMEMVNRHLERWIVATPEQWLWLHRRWPD